MKPYLCIHLILLCVCTATEAQDVPSAKATAGHQDPVVQQLLDRIEKLEKRVAELEGQDRNTSPGPEERVAEATSSAQAQQPGAEAHDQMGSMESQSAPGPQVTAPQSTAAEAAQVYPSLHLQGYGDVDYVGSDGRPSRTEFGIPDPQPLAHNTFLIGQLVLHFTSALSPRVNVFSELSFSGTSEDPVSVRIERAFIRFDQSDYLKVSFGRFHTPINYWNSTYHHGAWLQTSASRPEEIVFAGGLLPLHFVGAMAEGNLPAHGLNFHYDAGIGNGRGNPLTSIGDFDVNDNRAWLVNAYVRPNKAGRLRLGGSAYRDKFPISPTLQYREWITAANIALERETPEIIVEFTNIQHKPVFSSMTFNTQAMYAQVAYRLPWAHRLWKPYYRYERIHIPAGDAGFAQVHDVAGFQRSLVGVRYDITDYAALKAEYGREQHRAQLDANRFALQTAFTF